MYVMSELTKKNVERVVGVSVEQIKRMTPAEEREIIERKISVPLGFSSKRRYGIVGRGNPLLSRRRIRSLEDVDNRSKRLFGV